MGISGAYGMRFSSLNGETIIVQLGYSASNLLIIHIKPCVWHFSQHSKYYLRTHRLCSEIISGLRGSRNIFGKDKMLPDGSPTIMKKVTPRITTINELQYIQNSTGRVLTYTKKSPHITPVLHRLHWLPYSIQDTSHHIQSPPWSCSSYISDLIHTQYTPIWTLRSSESGLLLVPRNRSVTGPSVSLPPPSGIPFPNTLAASHDYTHFSVSQIYILVRLNFNFLK